MYKPYIVGTWCYKFTVIPQGYPHFPCEYPQPHDFFFERFRSDFEGFRSGFQPVWSLDIVVVEFPGTNVTYVHPCWIDTVYIFLDSLRLQIIYIC